MKNVTKVVTRIAAVAGALSLGNTKVAQADATTQANQPVTNTEMKTDSNTAEAVKESGTTVKEAVKTTKTNIKDTIADQQTAGESLEWAKQNVADATPENVQKNQDSQAQVSAKIVDDQAAEQTAEDALANGKQAQQQAQADADTADQNVAKQQTAVDQAQKNSDDKQATVNADQQKLTDEQAAKDAAEKRTQTNAQDTAAAQTKVDQANAAVTAKQAEQTTAQANVDAANKAAQPAKDALTAAQKAQQSAQAAVDATEAKINAATATTAEKNTITLAPGINNALFDTYDQATDANRAAVTASTQAVLGKTSAIASNKYQSNAADAAVTVSNLDNLTGAQQQELTLFAANLINQLRTQMGNLKVAVTADSLKFANAVAKRYVADQWSWKGHDVAGIEAVAATFGLDSTGNYYENLSNGYLADATTMDDLKQGIYNTVLGMIADDKGSGFGHADALTGHNDGMDINDQQYMGIAVDSMGQVHILMVKDSPAYVTTPGKFNMTDTINLTPSATTDADVTALNAQLATQKATLAAAKQDVAAKQGAATQAQAKQTDAQKALDQVNADLTKLNAQLTAAQNQLTQLKQQQVTDAATLKNAPAEIAALQAKLADDIQALKDAQPALVDAQASLKASQAVAAQKHVALDAAKANVAQLTDALTAAQATTKNDTAILESLSLQAYAYDNADQILAAVQAIYDQVGVNLATLQAYLTELQAADGDSVRVSQTANGQTTMQLAHQANRVNVTLPAVKATGAQADRLGNQATLPQTDEQSAAPISLLGVALLGLVGLGYAGLRRKFQ